MINLKSFLISEEYHLEQDLYSLSLLGGLFKAQMVRDLVLISFAGFKVFKAVGDKSLLLGVNWNGF